MKYTTLQVKIPLDLPVPETLYLAIAMLVGLCIQVEL